MEAMDKRKEERLVKGIVLNTLIFIGCIVYIIMVIMPKYDDIGTVTANTNAVMDRTSSFRQNGVDKASFEELLNQSGKKKEVPDVVFSDPEKLERVLKKPETVKKDYLAWLLEENGKVSALDKEIQENEAILGNIIPVFANSLTVNNSSDIDNQITLASFISYIEKDILSRYSLTSYMPLGISSVVFPDKKETPINIGSFKINLDFKGRNSNILSLVDALQKSGKLTVRNGKITANSNTDTSAPKGK